MARLDPNVVVITTSTLSVALANVRMVKLAVGGGDVPASRQHLQVVFALSGGEGEGIQ